MVIVFIVISAIYSAYLHVLQTTLSLGYPEELFNTFEDTIHQAKKRPGNKCQAKVLPTGVLTYLLVNSG